MPISIFSQYNDLLASNLLVRELIQSSTADVTFLGQNFQLLFRTCQKLCKRKFVKNKCQELYKKIRDILCLPGLDAYVKIYTYVWLQRPFECTKLVTIGVVNQRFMLHDFMPNIKGRFTDKRSQNSELIRPFSNRRLHP